MPRSTSLEIGAGRRCGGVRDRARRVVDGLHGVDRGVGDLADLLQLGVHVIEGDRGLAEHRHHLAHRLVEVGGHVLEQRAQPEQGEGQSEAEQDQKCGEGVVPGVCAGHGRRSYPRDGRVKP